MGDMVGASSMEDTVTLKLRVDVVSPSLTVIVMVDVPKALATGVIVNERVAPLPESDSSLLEMIA